MANTVSDTNIWRYENYGTASLLKISGNTVTGLSADKSKTGSAFWQNQRVATFPIPATKELWVKFDLYYGNAQWRAYDRLDGNDTGVGRYQQANTLTSFINGPLQYSLNPKNTLTVNQLKTYLLHMVSDAENGLVELWVDGVKYYSDDFASEGLIYKGNVEGGADFDNFYLQSASSANLFSNVIISNARIGLGENVIGQGLSSYLDFDIVRDVKKTFIPLTLQADLVRGLVNHLFFPVTAVFDIVREVNSSHFPLSLNFDTLRDLREVWRYENYGTTDLLIAESQTVYDDTQQTFEVPVEFSRTGYGYMQYGDPKQSRVKHFDVPADEDIWIKFDCFIDDLPNINSGSVGLYRLHVGNNIDYSDYTGVDIDFADTNTTTISAVDDLTVFKKTYNKTPVQFLKIHRVMLHLRPYAMDVYIDSNNCLVSSAHGKTNFDKLYLFAKAILLSNIIISNKKLNIFEDVSTISYPKKLILDCGLYRDVHQGVWRYENLGSDNSLAFPVQTFTDLPSTQSKTGSAFVQNTPASCFLITPTNEVWLQFDVYVQNGDQSDSVIFAGIRNPDYEGNNSLSSRGFDFKGVVVFSQDRNSICSPHKSTLYDRILPFYSVRRYYDVKNSDWANRDRKKILPETLSTCLLHMKIGDDVNVLAGLIEFWIDGEKIFDVICNVNDGQVIDKLILVTQDNGNNPSLFSNIIISNAHPNLKVIQGDLCRVLFASVNLYADTVRTLPHKVFSAPIDSFGDVPDFNQSCNGLQQFEIRIAEQQLTDLVTYTTINPVNILEQVNGHFLDYKFNMRIESIQQRGILYSCNCCSDIDEILFTQIEYNVPENEKWHWADGSPEVYGSPDSTFKKPEDVPPAVEASVHVAHIAEVLNKNYVIQFDDFVSTVDGDSGGVTYNDLIRSIFGWSSRIPHKLINCYIRDDTLFVVQRGHEQNIIDLSDATFEIVTRNKSLMRTFWGNEIWSKTETRSEHIGWRKIYDEDDNKTKQSQNGNANYSYDNSGLVTHTSIYNDDGTTTDIDYHYTTLGNGRKVLASESHSVYKDGQQIDYQEIQHTYLNQGQSHVMATGEGGDYLGSDVGQSIGDDRVTPWGKYTSRVYQAVFKDKERTIYGLTNFDSSFPIDGDKKLKEITADIIWLNRKTQEIITINLYDFPHVIDFNDRLIVNGAEFFLKSNVAVQTPRIVNKQTLQLVRWY